MLSVLIELTDPWIDGMAKLVTVCVHINEGHKDHDQIFVCFCTN